MKKLLKRFCKTAFAPVMCALLGFAGALCITPFSGMATALPILPLCALAAGFLEMKPGLKILLFALWGGLMRAGYSAEMTDILVFALVCAACAGLGHYAVVLFKNRKYRFWAVVPLGAAVAIQMAFGGNIVSCINAKILSDDYVNQNYAGENETAEGLEYHYISRTWRREIKSSPVPVVIGELVIYGDHIQDNYVNKVEHYLMTEQRAAVANALRDAFPNGSFKVEAEKIYGYPDGDVFTTDKTDYTNRMVFTVYLGALTDEEGFLNTAALYREALESAGIDAARIIFRGGGHGLYPMEEVYFESPLQKSRIKFNCGSVFYPLQRELDKHFGNEQLVYIKGEKQ